MSAGARLNVVVLEAGFIKHTPVVDGSPWVMAWMSPQQASTGWDCVPAAKAEMRSVSLYSKVSRRARYFFASTDNRPLIHIQGITGTGLGYISKAHESRSWIHIQGIMRAKASQAALV